MDLANAQKSSQDLVIKIIDDYNDIMTVIMIVMMKIIIFVFVCRQNYWKQVKSEIEWLQKEHQFHTGTTDDDIDDHIYDDFTDDDIEVNTDDDIDYDDIDDDTDDDTYW